MPTIPIQPSPSKGLENMAQDLEAINAEVKSNESRAAKFEAKVHQLQRLNKNLKARLKRHQEANARLQSLVDQQTQVEHVFVQRLPAKDEIVTMLANTKPGNNRPEADVVITGYDQGRLVVTSYVDRRAFKVEPHEIVFKNIGERALGIAVGSISDIVRYADLLLQAQNQAILREHYPREEKRVLAIANLAANAGKKLRALLSDCKGNMTEALGNPDIQSLFKLWSGDDVHKMITRLGLENDTEDLLKAYELDKLQIARETKQNEDGGMRNIFGQGSLIPYEDQVQKLKKFFKEDYTSLQNPLVTKNSVPFKLFFSKVILYTGKSKPIWF